MSKARFVLYSIFVCFAMFLASGIVPQKSLALTSFTITPPTGTLVRDQDYDFTVNINTGTDVVSSIQANVNYDTTVLQMVSVTQGNFFDSVTYQETTPGTILLTGTNTSAKSGSGSFAVIKFKLIATSSGSTSICTVSPVTTPTPTVGGPTATPTITPTPGSVVPTTPPQTQPLPTQIPTAGAVTGWQVGVSAALILLVLGAVGMILL